MNKKLLEIYNDGMLLVNSKKITYQDLIWLLKETFHFNDADLILKKNDLYDDTLFNERLIRAGKGEPIAYILNSCPFYKRDFYVDENVLIPRVETEELISLALDKIKTRYIDKTINIIDIGTGSGCIAISLQKELAGSKLVKVNGVTGVDISIDTLRVAEKNKSLQDANVIFYKSDCFDEVIKRGQKYDVIISNPPYIKKGNYVEKSVLDYEPHLALFADNDGLAIYEKIFKQADKVIKDDGIMFFEISPDLEMGLIKLVKKYFCNAKYEFVKDINKFVRFFIVYLD